MLRFGESVQEYLTRKGISRRDFLKFCGVMAGALALPPKASLEIVITSYSIHYTKLYDAGRFLPSDNSQKPSLPNRQQLRSGKSRPAARANTKMGGCGKAER